MGRRHVVVRYGHPGFGFGRAENMLAFSAMLHPIPDRILIHDPPLCPVALGTSAGTSRVDFIPGADGIVSARDFWRAHNLAGFIDP